MSQYANLNQKLKNIFQIDRPDLDFGIYRILNARRKEIADYLDNRLKQKVESYLTQAKSDVQDSQLESIAHELKEEFGKRAFDDAGKLVDEDAIESSLGQRYIALLEQSGNAFDETQVYSHLYTFFSRYYDEGDFISQRRYKGDTYAIPYAGEEVMLHWANKDQYYTKSGEMFSNYRIRFNSIGESDKTVLFRLLSADTAKDNQKDNDKNRRFIILSKPKKITRIDEEGEEYEETVHPLELSSDGKEMTIWFEYAVMDSKANQDKLNVEAHNAILDSSTVSSQWAKLMTHPAPTEKNPNRDLLLKHLDTYTQKNTADYFIHKDLGKFLSNELDFYIKNEVMHLDDVVNSSSFVEIEKKLAMIKCLRKIGQKLIDFLASLENFQKKLWLKKKFVVSSHYCITLDRVDEDLYDEIASNPEQWQQWEDLGLKVEGDFVSDWGKAAYLKSHPYLMVDTSLFDTSFKAKLLNTINDLDEQTDGLIINSDNFQALNLLQRKYKQNIECIYIDPPYNTSASEIIYKNSYKHSSWLSLLDCRLLYSQILMTLNANICVTIDDLEANNLGLLLDDIFGKDNQAGIVPIRSNPSGRPSERGFALTHEYAFFYGNSNESSINRIARTKEQLARFNEKDSAGIFEYRNLRREGSNSDRKDGEKQFYPIYANIETGKIRVPRMAWKESQRAWDVEEEPVNKESVIYPINDKGVEKNWRWSMEHVKEDYSQFLARIPRGGTPQVYYKYRPKTTGTTPLTLWTDSKYSATEYGTKTLKDLFEFYSFSYPKSVYAVVDSIGVLGAFDNTECKVMDFFAGSGTTAQAVMHLNRKDKGSRKYILVEQGEYFDTVLKPRIQKVVYSDAWKSGQPLLPKKIEDEANPYQGISHCVKVIKLESYEDTLNNLELIRTQEQEDLFGDLTPEQKDDYLMHYMLDIESQGSLLNVNSFRNPFDYQLKVAADSAGAYTEQSIDLIDTFNYLIGLKVDTIDYQLEQGFVQVIGHLRNGEEVTVFWRDCDKIGYEELDALLKKLRIKALDSEFDQIYINGDHNINAHLVSTEGAEKQLKVRSIEQVFFELMFAE
ncbi:DNA methyltransferase [Psychrobacter sp.]|uniref:site-specific DNA-methyltransferase n=1 Tax=Psychrobacter sp. TaxID=56811 RepID=UPI0025EEAFCF|nr:DNA methyltransferase [Psychrobacter sp.]